MALGTAIVLAVDAPVEPDGSLPPRRGAAIGVAALAVIAAIVSYAENESAETRLFDAINAHNATALTQRNFGCGGETPGAAPGGPR